MGYYDLSHSMGRWISFIYRMSQSYVDQYFKRYNLSSGQFAFLLLLYREDGRKQDDLAKAIDMDKELPPERWPSWKHPATLSASATKRTAASCGCI